LDAAGEKRAGWGLGIRLGYEHLGPPKYAELESSTCGAEK